MIPNKAPFVAEEIIAYFGEEAAIGLDENWRAGGVSTDTRTLEKGQIFVALKGENFDGGDFVEQAFEKGAAACAVEEKWFSRARDKFRDKPFIIAKSGEEALGKLAKIHRAKFDIPVAAIAGSNGKTTTKDLTAFLLSKKYRVLKSEKNFNNKIGVPLAILNLDESVEAAVFEIGTNEPGEIRYLSELVAPDFGLIVNIGKEHLEKLIDLDGVEMEETALFGYLHKKGGLPFINADDPRLKKYSKIFENVVSFGESEEAQIRGKISLDENLSPIVSITIENSSIEAKMKTFGKASALNALAAAAIAFAFGLSAEEIKEGLESFENLSDSSGYARGALEKARGAAIINDCYNANPDSMALALENLSLYPAKGKKYAILGDMLELGESARAEHAEILKKAARVADEIFVFGENFATAAKNFAEKPILAFDDKRALAEKLLEKLEPGDAVLVKGSRGTKMEEIIAALKNG